MLIDAPIPESVTEEMRVTFLPQFLGAFPKALSPFGALAYRGVRAILVEDSSTKTRRSGSMPLRRSLKALLASSFRSVAPSVFFCSSTLASLLWLGSSRRWTPELLSSPPTAGSGARGWHRRSLRVGSTEASSLQGLRGCAAFFP